MKSSVILIVTTMLAACSSLQSYDPGPEQRAARNLCEVMRSYRPYYPNQCGEQSPEVPYAHSDR